MKTPDAGADNRTRERIPFAKDIFINKALRVRAIDISEGGLYVHTGRSNVPGNIVEVTIPTSDGNMTLRARVQHNQEGVGMGLRFVDLSRQQRLGLRRLIDGLVSRRAVSPEEAGRPQSRVSILLIDSNNFSLRIFKSRLVFEGFTVVDAPNSGEAMKLLSSGQSRFDVMVLDIGMDREGGFRLLSSIKKREELTDVPIIVLSSMQSHDLMVEAVAKGAEKCLSKVSTSPADLAQLVRDIVGRGRRSARLNCWDVLKCGKAGKAGVKEKAGLKRVQVSDAAVCPAAAEKRLNRVHGGVNAGRACWAIVPTMCYGEVQETLDQKYRTCLKCAFFSQVRAEEDKDYQDSMFLLSMLSDNRDAQG